MGARYKRRRATVSEECDAESLRANLQPDPHPRREYVPMYAFSCRHKCRPEANMSSGHEIRARDAFISGIEQECEVREYTFGT